MTLALAGNPEIRSAVAGEKPALRFPDLLGHLGYEDELDLLSRSASWPPAARSALYRTFRTPRLRRRLRQQMPRFSSIGNKNGRSFQILTN
jgi:hypothetical protein